MRYQLASGVAAVCAALAAPPQPAAAHGGGPPAPADLWHAWNWAPAVPAGIALAGLWYAAGMWSLWRRAATGRGVRRWQAAAFAGGLLALAAALVSPLDALGAALFSAHMVQHLLLILAAAPLLVLGAPLVPCLWALPRPWRRAAGGWWRRARLPRAVWGALTQPLTAWALHAAVLWLWHAPSLFQRALTDETVHSLEHASFLATALLFWWTVLQSGRRGRLRYGTGLLSVFTMAVQSGALGALITFAPAPWYPAYAPFTAAWGLAPVEDQQIAGLIMWVPAGLVYFLAIVLLFGAWLGAEERQARRREGWPAATAPPRQSTHPGAPR